MWTGDRQLEGVIRHFNQPAVSHSGWLRKWAGLAWEESRRTGSWALCGRICFCPNRASRFDVMRTREHLVRNCQLWLNLISSLFLSLATSSSRSLCMFLCLSFVLIFFLVEFFVNDKEEILSFQYVSLYSSDIFHMNMMMSFCPVIVQTLNTWQLDHVHFLLRGNVENYLLLYIILFITSQLSVFIFVSSLSLPVKVFSILSARKISAPGQSRLARNAPGATKWRLRLG